MNNTMVTKEVATELLCKAGVRMTNKERKTFNQARWRLTNPEKFEHLGIQHRLDYRLQQRSWRQLCKWIRRALARRKDTQAKYQMLTKRQTKLGEKTGPPSDHDIQELLIIQQGLAALNGKALVLDTFLEAVESEISRRQKLWESVKKAGAPEFAKKLENALKQ